MSNRIALLLLAAVVAALVLDATILRWGLPVLIMDLIVRATDWLAFWR